MKPDDKDSLTTENGSEGGHFLPLLVRWFRRNPRWKIREVKSPMGYVFTVRECPEREREIKSPTTGQWKPESQVHFSLLPAYEAYHRGQYEMALSFSPNVKAQGCEQETNYEKQRTLNSPIWCQARRR